MAIIKSGDTVDQLHVDMHQAAYVTLRDASGAAVTPLASGGAVTVSNLPATQPVSAASLPLPANAAVETGGHLASIDTKLSGPLAVTGAVTSSGTVAVTNFPATQPVSLAAAVTTNQGSPAGAANAWPMVLTNAAGTQQVRVTTANNLGVDLASSVAPNTALPAQTAWVGGSDGTKLQGLLVDGAGALKVNSSANTQPVSLTSTPLPANAAVETGGNLAALNTKITTTANGVKVDGSAVTQPVSGSVSVSAMPAVTGTVAVSNFPASQAVIGAFFQATQPVSAAALPLPTGAATAAKQPAIGTAGASSSDVLSIQGVAGATAVFISGSVNVSNFPATQPVSAAALPLPTNAATDTNLTARTPQGANGALSVTLLDGATASYAAGVASLAVASTATDIFTIYGSATKTVKIARVCVSFVATTAISVPVSLVKRSAVNTGGTSAAVVATPFDSNSAAATATCLSYTANPTAVGALVGSVLEAGKVAAPLTGGALQVSIFDFGQGLRQAPTLRGTAQGLAINLNGVTVVGGSAAVSIEWTES